MSSQASTSSLQSITESPISQSSQIQQRCSPVHSPMDLPYHPSFTNQGSMHPLPPVHHQLPTSTYLPPGKPDSDTRLPGMMALSQPGTPRPNQLNTSPTMKKSQSSFNSSSLHTTPYASINRKKSRGEVFSTELGPFFSSTKPMDNLYALDRSTLLSIRIQAKMDRGFFLADNDWTCYRRNYFQVSSAFSLQGLSNFYPEETQCLVELDGIFYPVHHFSLNIGARVSNSDKKIELIQHTPKRDKGPQSTPSPKLIVPGGNLTMSSVGAHQSIATFERIQFKTATANNGKRRAAQQYYVCVVDLYAEIDGGARRVKIASCQSAPLVVRGRSPGHYSDHHHSRFESNLATAAIPPPPPHLTQQNDDGNNRFVTPSFPRPPMTPPAVMGPDYNSHYPSYPSYQPNYSHFHPMMMPPTPTGSLPPPPNSHPYMIPGMTTSDPSSSETSSPDLYHHGPGPNTSVLHEDANKHSNFESWNHTRNSHHYDHEHNSYFTQSSTNQSPYHNDNSSPYGAPRKYSSISQQTSS